MNVLFKVFKFSGEDQSTPKSRKGDIMFNQPSTPTQANASPGASGHPHSGEDFEMGSPPWPRTPASPVFNSHAAAATPTESYRSTKVKVSLCITILELKVLMNFSFRNPIV